MMMRIECFATITLHAVGILLREDYTRVLLRVKNRDEVLLLFEDCV